MKRQKRTWTVDEKLTVLKEADEHGIVQTCRKHGVYQSLYYVWKEKFDSGGVDALKPQYVKRNEQELQKIKRENAKLKQLLAEKELELQMKSELLKKRFNNGRS